MFLVVMSSCCVCLFQAMFEKEGLAEAGSAVFAL